jgi:hypothetical protein
MKDRSKASRPKPSSSTAATSVSISLSAHGVMAGASVDRRISRLWAQWMPPPASEPDPEDL